MQFKIVAYLPGHCTLCNRQLHWIVEVRFTPFSCDG
jgi:hypothetical protein